MVNDSNPFRSWLRKITNFRNKIRNSAYPVRVESLWILIAVVNGLHFSDKTSNYGLLKLVTGLGVFAG